MWSGLSLVKQLATIVSFGDGLGIQQSINRLRSSVPARKGAGPELPRQESPEPNVQQTEHQNTQQMQQESSRSQPSSRVKKFYVF